MQDPHEVESDAPARPPSRRSHFVVLGLFTLLVAPLLRPSHPECPARVAQAFARGEPSAPSRAALTATCRRDLLEHPRADDPVDWARTQLGLGALLAQGGEREPA